MAFIKQLNQDQVDELVNFDLKDSAENCKSHAAVLKARMQLLGLFFMLPDRIQEAEEQIEVNRIRKQRFKDAQEEGGIN